MGHDSQSQNMDIHLLNHPTDIVILLRISLHVVGIGIVGMKADAEEDDYIGGVIQKMNIHVLRLTIMAHLLSDHWNEPVITGEAMNYAICVSNYFTRIHIERIYPLLKDPSGMQRTMTNGDLIRTLNKRFKIKSQNFLAEALGVTQQYINKTLKTP